MTDDPKSANWVEIPVAEGVAIKVPKAPKVPTARSKFHKPKVKSTRPARDENGVSKYKALIPYVPEMPDKNAAWHRNEGLLKLDKVTLDRLHSLAMIQCTHAQAAAKMGVHRVTLSKFINANAEARDAWDSGLDSGCVSLRSVQFLKAIEGNVIMLIWLGKQWLGQRDQISQEVKVEGVDSKEELRQILNAMKDRVEKVENGQATENLGPEPSGDNRTVN